MNMRIKFKVRSSTRSWDNRGYFKTLGSPWMRPRSFCSKVFNGRLFGWTLWMYPAKFEVRSFTRSWDNSGYLKTLGSSRSSKVIDFGTNLKRVWRLPISPNLVGHSNLGPILHCFGDIAGFLCSWVTPPLFHLNLGGYSRCTRLSLLGSARADVLSYSAVQLFSKYANRCDHGIWTLQPYGRADRQTDDILWHNRALRSIAR